MTKRIVFTGGTGKAGPARGAAFARHKTERLDYSF